MKLCPHPQCNTGFPDHAETCPTHGGVLSEIRELKPGMVIHKTYRIVRKLGQGGMGTVYLADHIFMQEQRALKFLSPELSQDEGFTSRFRREVKTLRQIRHRNVVDCGDLEPAEDDSLFFAMEFVDGPDLWDFLQKVPRPFDVALALTITQGIAEGLGAAHALGMVHRDIKPENILMARAGDTWVPKIADFGIVATKESASARTRTRTGGTLLTMQYAAPEQWRGVRAAELDGRTDLYALGGVLFEMLTGQTVFSAESYEGWAEQHKNAAPRKPSDLRPELLSWPRLDSFVLKMLSKDTEARPKNIAEMLMLLGAIQSRTAVPSESTISAKTGSEPVMVPTPTSDGNHVEAVAFSPDGRILASIGDQDKTIKLWDVSGIKIPEAPRPAPLIERPAVSNSRSASRPWATYFFSSAFAGLALAFVVTQFASGAFGSDSFFVDMSPHMGLFIIIFLVVTVGGLIACALYER